MWHKLTLPLLSISLATQAFNLYHEAQMLRLPPNIMHLPDESFGYPMIDSTSPTRAYVGLDMKASFGCCVQHCLL